MNANTNTELLSTSDAAKLLGVTRWALDQRRFRGDARLPYLRIAGAVRYLRADIEAFRTSGQLRRSPTEKKN